MKSKFFLMTILAFIAVKAQALDINTDQKSDLKVSSTNEEETSLSNKESEGVFILSTESPLNKESLDLNQALFIGEPSPGFNLRNPLEGTSGGNACSSCSH